MYPSYPDLRDRLGEPLWHDRHGVPRYAPYHPRLCDVYDRASALIEIACQACGRTFPVAATWCHGDDMDALSMLDEAARATYEMGPEWPTATSPGAFTYGDAPYHCVDDHLCIGTTMTTDTVRILECWKNPVPLGWRRCPEYEFDYRHEPSAA